MAEHNKRIKVSITATGLQERIELSENFEDFSRRIRVWLIARTRKPRRFVQPSALALWRAARRKFGTPPVEVGEGE